MSPRGAMPPRSSRAPRPRFRGATLPARSPNWRSFRPTRARPPRPGSRARRGASPPSTRAGASPPTRSRGSASDAGEHPGTTVTRGLDPRVHLLRKKHFAKTMDCRVKPGNDGERYESQIRYYELHHDMIRVIFYLILVAALAFGAVWMADRPGEVAITWQGTRIDTSVLVLIAAVAAVVVAAVIVWSILRAIVRAPETIARYRRYRRGVRGYLAVSQGLIAVGSGDARAAKRFTAEAVRIAPREPLTLLLNAQSAQLSGDHDTAVATFQEMASRDDTRVLGLHGLFVEAQRRADHAAALTYAEEAARHASVPVWAAQAVLEFRCVAGDWSGALERLDRNLKSRLIDRRTYRRQRAVLLTAQAQAIAGTDRERATALAREAAKLAPDLVPAAALAARLLGEAGERRKAARIIERAWHANPHPNLADVYVALRPGDSARQRLSRVEALAAKGPADAEAALAVARAALDAKEFAAARTALAPYTAAPRRRVAALMAELELAQGDEGRLR